MKIKMKVKLKSIMMIWILVLIGLTKYCNTFPSVDITHNNHLLTDFSDAAQNYLMEFGYLPKSDHQTGNLRTQEQLTEAIKNLQKFGNIPETGLMDAATRGLMRKPRCGVPDSSETAEYGPNDGRWRRRTRRYVIQGNKWDHTDISWRIEKFHLYGLNEDEVKRILRRALNVWADNSKLTFRETNRPEADIQVQFVRGNHNDSYNFDGPGQVLAHAFYPGSGRGGDAHFDADETWALNDDDERPGTSLMGVAVHEFGHSLGLGHSSVKGAIMFPWYQGYEKNRDLPEDDRIAIQQIYGSKERKWGINPQRSTRRTTTSTSTTTTTTTTTTTRPSTTTSYPYYYDYPGRRQHETERRPEERPIYPERRPTVEHPKHHHPHRPETPPRKPYYYPDYATPRHHHHQHHHRPTPPMEESPPHRPHKRKPITCETTYDAITLIRGEIFIFKNEYLWRIGPNGRLMDGYPHEIRRLWSRLPENLTHVDAVYENKDRKIIFFIGKQYYMFSTHNLDPGYPKPITELGLPASLNKIDAALVWGHNNRTYFYSGTMYWKFDEEVGRVELDYPRDMSMWRGIGYHIDSAFQYQGKTYFFKGKGYWEFNDHFMRVAHKVPKSSARRWMGCSSTDTNEVDTPRLPYIAEGGDDGDDDSTISRAHCTTFLPTHHNGYAFVYLVVLAVLHFRFIASIRI